MHELGGSRTPPLLTFSMRRVGASVTPGIATSRLGVAPISSFCGLPSWVSAHATSAVCKVRKRLSGILHTAALRLDPERRQAEITVLESEARHRMVAEAVSDMIFRTGLDATRLYVSPACREVLGYEPDELIGTPFTSLTHPDDEATVQSAWADLLSKSVPRQTFRYRLLHKQGHWVWCESRRRLVLSSDDTPLEAVSIVRDISERVSLEQQLHELARTDPLTGLLNRRAFQERLREEWSRALRQSAPVSLLSLDVDLFKPYNDHFGHSAGDECLRQVAQTLREGRRATDVLARIGGEEFSLLLSHTDAEGALRVAEAVRVGLEARGIGHPKSPYGVVTASIGVATMFPQAAEGEVALVNASDAALYEAKHAGRNRVAAGCRPVGPAAEPGAPASVYRVYRLRADGHIQSAHELSCETDAEAIAQARDLAAGHRAEVWIRSRRVAQIEL